MNTCGCCGYSVNSYQERSLHGPKGEVLVLRRHTLLENELNREQCSLLRWARFATNGVTAAVQRLRAQVQESRRAAGKATLQVLPKQQMTAHLE
jgi:hypothetical protein